MKLEVEREADGRWIAEVPDLPGVMSYGKARKEAVSKTTALALRVLADRLEHGEQIQELGEIFAVARRATGHLPKPTASWLPFSESGGRSSGNPAVSTRC